MKVIIGILLYLDPSMGSLMIQFIVAIVVGITVFFKQLREKIKLIVSIIIKKKTDTNK
jgi:hypothetical protein